ncbi:hypothetical protein MSIBF_A1760012 [groundwater metagenome]|uniref:Uncharacterized protein n=1 Tax=groundwater metagenome TaxID=717931 RepID=A0A098EA78_9ZZZZ
MRVSNIGKTLATGRKLNIYGFVENTKPCLKQTQNKFTTKFYGK